MQCWLNVCIVTKQEITIPDRTESSIGKNRVMSEGFRFHIMACTEFLSHKRRGVVPMECTHEEGAVSERGKSDSWSILFNEKKKEWQLITFTQWEKRVTVDNFYTMRKKEWKFVTFTHWEERTAVDNFYSMRKKEWQLITFIHPVLG